MWYHSTAMNVLPSSASGGALAAGLAFLIQLLAAGLYYVLTEGALSAALLGVAFGIWSGVRAAGLTAMYLILTQPRLKR